MSAAFQLQPAEPKRDKRTEFTPELLPDSDDALISHYGMGTRSWNRSSAKAEMDRQIEHAKERAALQPRIEYLAPLACECAQRPYPHELAVHLDLRSESYNPARRFIYPWSLCLSERRELSTERSSE